MFWNSRLAAGAAVLLLALSGAQRAKAEQFGEQTPFTSLLAIKDAIYAFKGAPAHGGVGDSVTAYLKFTFDSCKVRCALYTRVGDDTVLVTDGVTVERRFAINTAFTWQGFAFNQPKPHIQPGVEYFIALLGDSAGTNAGGSPRLGGLSSGGVLVNKTSNYESGFPPKLNPSTGVLNFRASVYCTYSIESFTTRRRHITTPRQQ